MTSDLFGYYSTENILEIWFLRQLYNYCMYIKVKSPMLIKPVT